MSTLSALHRQHLLARAGSKRDAVCAGRSVQWPERARFVRIVVVSHVRLALLFNQHPPTGQQLHHPGDDLVQRRLQRFIGWRRTLDEFRRPVGAAPVHAVQHQAVHVDVEREPL